jgi:hypothetical protein
MLLSKSPDIHFTVVVELGGKNGDAVQHRLNVTLTELATHRAGCVKYKCNRCLKGVQFILSETDRGFFSEAYKARRSGFQFLFQTDTSWLCWLRSWLCDINAIANGQRLKSTVETLPERTKLPGAIVPIYFTQDDCFLTAALSLSLKVSDTRSLNAQ